MPVQKDIEEGIVQTTLSSNENNDSTPDNINTINNNEASTQSSISSPSGNISTTSRDTVSHTLAPTPVEDTDQSTLIANLNTSHGHNNNETEQGSAGLVQIHDDNIAPLPPIATLESIPDSSPSIAGKKVQGKIEQIEDSTAPSLPTTEFESDIKRKIALETRIDIVNDEEDDAPVPFNVEDLDIEEDAKIKSRQIVNPRDDIGGDERGRDSLAIPTSDDLENDIGLYTTLTTPSSLRDRNGGVIVGSEEAVDNTNSSSAVEGGDNNANPNQTSVAVDRARNEMPTTLEQGQSDSIPIIPEAFLVEEESEDGIVFDAEPWLPWWKRKRFVGFLLLFAACVLAIAIGVGTHVGRRNTNVLTAELTPTISPAPSISLEPSSPPSECALTVSTNVQKLDMSKVDKPFETKIAMDKLNLVVVTRELDTTNVHIMFYLLKEGRWESNNHYIEDYGEVGTFNGNWDPSQSKISVALSGNVAMVGFPFSRIESNGGGTGHVFVFKQNDFGVWEKGDSLPIPESQRNSGKVYGFGSSIDIDGDAVSILSNYDLHVLENRNGEWNPSYISGGTIAIQMSGSRIDLYKYDRISKSYKSIQDFLEGSLISMTFNQDYLMYTTLSWSSDCIGRSPEGFYIYHQQGLSQSYHQTYVLQEFHNITGDGCIPSYRGDGYVDYTTTSIAHDSDLLAVGGINQTHIYVLDNNGSWEEQLALNNWYRQLQVSNRNILAATYNETTNEDEVYYFDIENCANTPTQMPSLSTSPSSSIHPTQWSTMQGTTGGTHTPPNPFRTETPTNAIYRSFCSNVSVAPTNTSIPQLLDPNETCYSIDIVVAFDDEPKDSVWDIKRVNPISNDEVLKVSRGTADDAFKLRKESVCLTAGVYQFTMHDERLTGGGLRYPGHYNVSSDGDLIVEGREFFCNSTTTFALPLTAAPSMMPSETASPTFSPSQVPSEPPSTSPTISPTVTFQPSLSPSVSSMPTFQPSMLPSTSPTVSSSPTKTCYQIDIVVVFDEYPRETSWQLQKMNDSGDYILIKTFNGSSDDKNKARKDSMCLEGEQTYQFTIKDSARDGIFAPGHYNITSEGNLIVQGGEFGRGEVTSFSLPYTPGSSTLTNVTQEPTTLSPTYPPPPTASQPITPFPTESTSQPTKSVSPTISSPPTTTSYPSSRPTSSSAPTTSVQPTQSPTVSSIPTETCYWIDIVVVYDQYPEETSLQLEKISDSGDKAVLKTVNGTSNDKYKARTESICLEGDKEYRFAIYDSFGDGILSPGRYNITSNDILIVQGGEFLKGEITSFSIPFIPGLAISSVITQAPTISPPPLTPFPTDPESTGSSPRPQNITLASPDSVSVSAGDEIFVSVLDNDTPEQALSINSITTPATNGSCSISLDWKEVVYIPNPGFTGFDTCVYEACDSVSACDTATLTVNVTSLKIDFVCPPVSYIGCTAADPIRPEDDCSEVGEPCPGQYIEYCCRDACRNYCTAKNFVGLSNVDTSSPVSSPDSDSSPVARPDSANLSTTTSEYGLAFVSVLDNDTPTAGLDGETLFVRSIAAQASNGDCAISLDSREVVYEPDPGFTGLDSCVYEACDSVPACDTAMLTIIVTSQTTHAIASPNSPMPPPQTSPSACEDITTKKDCTKSTNNCIWDTTVEGGGPMCVSSEA